MSRHKREGYIIKHVFDVDGGFGDAVRTEVVCGVVKATEDEIIDFLNKWDKPRVYDRPYADLYDHHIVAEKIQIANLETFQPYDPNEGTYLDDDEEE